MNNSDSTIASNKQNNGNNKRNKKRHNKSLTDINEEQILNFVQKEFIKAYMSAYSQRNVTDKELSMFTKYLKNIKPVNTSSNHYVNRIKSLCNEMKGYYSQFQKLNYILGINFNQDRTN